MKLLYGLGWLLAACGLAMVVLYDPPGGKSFFVYQPGSELLAIGSLLVTVCRITQNHSKSA